MFSLKELVQLLNVNHPAGGLPGFALACFLPWITATLETLATLLVALGTWKFGSCKLVLKLCPAHQANVALCTWHLLLKTAVFPLGQTSPWCLFAKTALFQRRWSLLFKVGRGTGSLDRCNFFCLPHRLSLEGSPPLPSDVLLSRLLTDVC